MDMTQRLEQVLLWVKQASKEEINQVVASAKEEIARAQRRADMELATYTTTQDLDIMTKTSDSFKTEYTASYSNDCVIEAA